jgi:hypothetical protein
MRLIHSLVALFLVAFASVAVQAGTTVDELRREVDALRKQLNDSGKKADTIGKVDMRTSAKYGPNNVVETKAGKLNISGLIQIWNYSIEDDHVDVFGREGGVGGTSEFRDNNGYRIRRTELKFTMDIHENITAVLMFDPAREASSFAPLGSNQGTFKSKKSYAPEFFNSEDPGPGSTSEASSLQTGGGTAGTLLQDAYINYHGVIPHHDFTIGQFKRPIGEEGTRHSGYLDFAERAMVTQDADLRDLGIQVHGTWWNDRFQYWLGAFNGGSDFFGTRGQFQNRSDDNDEKDLAARFLVRPIWNKGCWGSMELGASTLWGIHGEESNADPVNNPVNGLNRNETNALRHAAWAMYKPMGIVRGWWMRGEYGYQKDRAAPGSVGVFGLGDGDLGEQTAGNAFSRDGFYIATGYKLTDSVFADRLSRGGFFNNLLQPVEFAFRYEKFGNIIAEDLNKPNTNTDVFQTDILTVGVNYYVKAFNSRVQVNYMLVNEEENKVNNGIRHFEEVNNNVFIFTYQLMF